ncbi:hypothetical protein QQ045_030091 [Rhodiola kirilowii]
MPAHDIVESFNVDNIRQEVENTIVEETGNRKSEEKVQERTNQKDGVNEKEEREIIVESNDVGPNAGQNVSSQQISSCGDRLFYYEPLGGLANPRDIMRNLMKCYKDDKTYQALEEIAKANGQVQQEGTSHPIEEPERGYEDHEVMHNSDDECDQVGDHSLMPTISIQQRTRTEKKCPALQLDHALKRKTPTSYLILIF